MHLKLLIVSDIYTYRYVRDIYTYRYVRESAQA